jgi:ParB-like chromosome segregation protein Spo0J
MNATSYTLTKNELNLSNAERKARLEAEMRQMVGRGWLDVRQAQQLLAEDWPMAYERLVVRTGA